MTSQEESTNQSQGREEAISQKAYKAPDGCAVFMMPFISLLRPLLDISWEYGSSGVREVQGKWVPSLPAIRELACLLSAFSCVFLHIIDQLVPCQIFPFPYWSLSIWGSVGLFILQWHILAAFWGLSWKNLLCWVGVPAMRWGRLCAWEEELGNECVSVGSSPVRSLFRSSITRKERGAGGRTHTWTLVQVLLCYLTTLSLEQPFQLSVSSLVSVK